MLGPFHDEVINLLIFTIFLIICYFFIYKKIQTHYDYFKRRGIPYEPVKLEDFRSISFSFLLDYCKFKYDKFKDEAPYIGIFQSLFMPVFLIMDSKLVESVLIKDFSHFYNRGIEINLDANPLLKNLFGLKGDEWRTLRHKLIPAFLTGKLKGMVPLMEECADILINEMKSDPKLRVDVKMNTFYNKYTKAAMANCVFGFDPISVQDPKCDFEAVVDRLIHPTSMDGIKFFFFLTFPRLASFFRIKIWQKEFEKIALNLTKEAFRMREESGVKKSDFLQILLELKEKGSIDIDVKDSERDEINKLEELQSDRVSYQIEMTDELLSAQLFIFLIAGFQNITLLNTVTTYALAKHPDIQDRVRKEVREAKNKYGGFTYEAVRDMKLLEACMDEVMRLWFPMVLFRECNKQYELPDGKIMEKGATVCIPGRALHLDGKYWPHPNEFYPDFFLDKKNIRPGTYMPFGEGPRICIGKRLSQIMVKVMLAKLIDEFEFIPSLLTHEPVTLGLSQTGDFDKGSYCTFNELKDD